jgi:hypothetical protein
LKRTFDSANLKHQPANRRQRVALNIRREAARGFFEALERELRSDEILSDRKCVAMILDKAHGAESRKRFDIDAAFRNKLLYPKIDDVLVGWCRRREIKADPYRVFRFIGPERGPTQHETAIGPSVTAANRLFDRLVEAAPEIADCRAKVLKAETSAVSPALRLQFPLPFGAAGECKYGGNRKDLDRAIAQVVVDVATGGDVSRGWRYDCGLLIFYGAESPGSLRHHPGLGWLAFANLGGGPRLGHPFL